MVEEGVTITLAPAAPLDHITVPVHPAAVKVTLEPLQTEDALAVTVGAEIGVTVIT